MAPLRCWCPCPSLVAALVVLSLRFASTTTSNAKTSFVTLAFSFSARTASLGRTSPLTTRTSIRISTQLTAGTKTTIDDGTIPSVPVPPWYSDPTILRDRSHVIPADRGFDYRSEEEGDGGEACLSPTLSDVLARPTSRIIPFQDGRVFVKRAGSKEGIVEPLFLRYEECDRSWFDGSATMSWLGGQESSTDEDNSADYFALDIPSHVDVLPLLRDDDDGDCIVESAAVRNYGDEMPSRSHAALLATANGLLSFHASHRFCTKCGSPTKQIKAGSARKCSTESCGASVYPRIDPAVIMLVTSPCRNYALLGRKKSWPSGQYSTLAGFVEVGETLEECVVRETLEESGIRVDPTSIRFSASQPWPFPRSMMLGYHATAATCKTSSGADDLPSISIDPAELEDAQWFSKEYIKKNGLVEGRGSSALDFDPDDEEAEFHVPGPASLARLLITEWVRGE